MSKILFKARMIAEASRKPLFANLKILDVFSTYIIMMLYLLLLLKSFKLEIRFINIQQDTLTFDFIPVEQILKNCQSCFKVLECGIHYRTTSKTLQLLIYSSTWSNHFWGSDKIQPKYLNTSYLYFSLNTLKYLKYTSFFFIFKCHLAFKLPVGENLYSL